MILLRASGFQKQERPGENRPERRRVGRSLKRQFDDPDVDIEVRSSCHMRGGTQPSKSWDRRNQSHKIFESASNTMHKV
jgi:hypothetical protein